MVECSETILHGVNTNGEYVSFDLLKLITRYSSERERACEPRALSDRGVSVHWKA